MRHPAPRATTREDYAFVFHDGDGDDGGFARKDVLRNVARFPRESSSGPACLCRCRRFGNHQVHTAALARLRMLFQSVAMAVAFRRADALAVILDFQGENPGGS